MAEIEGKRRTRLVTPPAAVSNLPFIAIRDEYIAICAGDHCAAAILSAFETWTVGRLDNEFPNSDGRPGWTEADAADVWIRKSQPELHAAMKGLFGKRRVFDSLHRLTDEWRYLSPRANPSNGQDKSLQYRFETLAVATALKAQVELIKTASPDSQNRNLIVSKPQDETVENASPDSQGRELGLSELQLEAVENATTVLENLNKTPLENPEKNPGGEDAREDPPPDFHPLVQAFLASTPEDFRPDSLEAYLLGEAARALEASTGATAAEIGALVEAKWRKPGRDRYDFAWLAEDLPKWRAVQSRLLQFPTAGVGPPGGAGLSAGDEYPDLEPAQWLASLQAEQQRLAALSSDPATPVVPVAADLPGEALAAWQTTRAQYESFLDRGSFLAWLNDAYLADVRDGATFVIAVATPAGRDILAYKFRRRMTAMVSLIYGQAVTLEYIVGRPPIDGGAPRQAGQAAWMQTIVQREKEAVT